MTRQEFAAVMSYILAGVGREMPREQAEVYFDLLKDLDAAVFLAAARAALSESEYPTLPTAGALRKQAARLTGGPEITWAEAWEQVRKVLNCAGVHRAKYLGEMHPVARRAAECLGWDRIATSTNGETLRAQFRDAFNGLHERERRERLLPPAARALIEGHFKMPELEAPRAPARPAIEHRGLFG